VPRELSQEDGRHLYHPKEDSVSHLDVLKKRVESFPIRVDKHALNIAISYSGGQINASLRLLIIMHVRNLQLFIYWEQDPKIPMCEFMSSGTIKSIVERRT